VAGVVLVLLATGTLWARELAAAGDLDTTFNQTGRFVTAFGPAITDARANAVAVQPDGKIVLAIKRDVQQNPTFALMRLNPDGSLDNTFSVGIVVVDLGGAEAEARAVAVQKDGKIVAAGYGVFGPSIRFVVARLNPDGSPDTSFDVDGVALADFGPGKTAVGFAVSVQKDGKIVVAGGAGDPGFLDFALARFTPDGRLDPSFSRDGKVTTDFGDDERSFALAIQKDGKIVAAGGTGEDGADFELARYQKNGRLDRSFGGDGKVTTDFGGEELANALVIQKDGRLVVAGFSEAADQGAIALARYQKDGRLDRSFDGDGKVLTDFGFHSLAFGVGIEPDGRIVVAGAATPGTEFDFLVARYQANGQPDPSFSTDGWLTTDFGDGDLAFGVAIQPDGRIVAAGMTGENQGQVAVARYLAQ
jgi:uncharacterized delta-60 repeat protein